MRATRRRAIAFLGAIFGAGSLRGAHAQTLNGCDIGFVNGVLQIDPACVITGPAGPPVTAPGHLAQPIVEADPDVATLSEERVEKLQLRRDKKHDQKGNGREKRRSKRERRRDQEKEQRARQIERVVCSDFEFQEEAQQWHDEHSTSNLIENDDGDVCLDRPSMFSDEAP